MPDDRSPLTRLVFAINEDDATARAKLLAALWAPGATLTIDGEVAATGVAELDALIASWLKDPKAWVSLLSHHETAGGETGRWRVSGDRVRSSVFGLVARTDDRGRLSALTATRTDPSATDAGLLRRFGETILSNPFAATGLIGGAFYLALRVPVGLFYGQLGVSPDEVGFGPEVLVPQSLTLVVVFLLAVAAVLAATWLGRHSVLGYLALEAIGDQDDPRLARQARTVARSAVAATTVAILVVLVVALPAPLSTLATVGATVAAAACLFTVLLVAMSVIARRAPLVRAWHQRLEARIRRRLDPRLLQRFLAELVAAYGAVLLLLLPFWALANAENVQEGGIAGGRITPWRALPVSLHWTKASHVALTNDCRVLRLLGTGDGQLVPYDTKLDKLFRVPVADASAAVDRDCA